jgi:hypothetical protein
MSSKIKAQLSVLFCTGLFVALASPVFTPAQGQMTSKQEKSVSITGCLQNGAQADQYELVAENGKKYEVTGSSVPLKDHVGHKVTVKGKLMGGSTSSSTPEQLEASSIKMISTSCTGK